MRTTITLAADVAAAVQERRRAGGEGISAIVNQLVRQGLAAAPGVGEFRQQASDMGRPMVALDDVAGLLDVLEGDDRRS